MSPKFPGLPPGHYSKVDVFGAQIMGARSNQEDAFRFEHDEAHDLLVAVVADGLGGCPYGEVASAVAVDAFVTRSIEDRRHLNCRDLHALIINALWQAHDRVRLKAGENMGMTGMCTTLVGFVADLSTGCAVVVSIGDSRVLGLQEDHLVDLATGKRVESWEDAPVPLTRVIGHELSGDITSREIQFDDYDLILLASDGIEGITADEVRIAISRTGTASSAVWSILKPMKIDRAYPHDNATIVAFSP